MVAYNYSTLTGLIIPDTVDIRTGVEGEYKALFGAGLNLKPSTPQGLLITAETSNRDAVARNNAVIANQINPNVSGGIFFDGIGALTGFKRNPNSYSVIPAVDVAGIPNAILPAGSLAGTTTGFYFQTVNQVAFDSTGAAKVNFQCTIVGPVAADIGTLTIIVSGPLAWETVNNTIAATLGTEEQSDEQARIARREQIAIQGQGSSLAITSAIYAVNGVKTLIFRENTSASTQVIDGVTMVGHSIYLDIDGGLDIDIATTLQSVKDGGCAYNGNVTVSVTDPYSGQIIPVQFSRPDLIPVLSRVTISANVNNLVPDPEQTVKAAILAYANGELPGKKGLGVGIPVSPFEFAGAINRLAPQIFVQKVEVSYLSPIIYVTTELPIEIYQKATINSGAIQVILV